MLTAIPLDHHPDDNLGGLVELAAAIRDGRVTATAVMERLLTRAARTEPVVHAYAYLDADAARAKATAADDLVAAGKVTGLLHGIPIGVKDLIATADMPTACGSRLLQGHTPETSAQVVQYLTKAGALIMGKHHTHEFGLGFDEPPTRNPRNLALYAGGSSVGGAVSVAVGSSLVAIGTDGGGSIRKPAAINGIVGFKPSHGRVNTRGILPSASPVDHVGWLTRTVADAAFIDSVLTGEPTRTNPLPLRGLRIGCPRFFTTDLDPVIHAAFDIALAILDTAGIEVVSVDIPEIADAMAAHAAISASAAFQDHRQWLESSAALYHPDSRAFLEAGAMITPTDVERAQATQTAVRVAVENAFRHQDVSALVTPTLPVAPGSLTDMVPTRDLPTLCRFTLPFNLTGHPALSLPGGVAPDGMPVGLQVVAPLGQDARVLHLAGALEQILCPGNSPRGSVWRDHHAHGDSQHPRRGREVETTR